MTANLAANALKKRDYTTGTAHAKEG